MTCDKIEGLLTAYADGELSLEEKASIEQHLEVCSDCASLLSFLRSADRTLAVFPEIEPRANLRQKLYAIPAQKKFRLGLDFLLKPSLQPVFAAATVFLIMFSFYMFSPDKNQINKAISRQFHRGYSQFEKLSAKAGSITDSLGAYADNVLVSLKKINPLSKNGE